MAPGSAIAPPPSGAEHASPALAAALNARSLDVAAACFCRDACLITADATAIRGRDNIRPVLRQLILMGVIAKVDQRRLLIAGDVALGSAAWELRFEPAGGAPFSQTASSTVVLCRVEGTWKLQIAAPWGYG